MVKETKKVSCGAGLSFLGGALHSPMAFLVIFFLAGTTQTVVFTKLIKLDISQSTKVDENNQFYGLFWNILQHKRRWTSRDEEQRNKENSRAFALKSIKRGSWTRSLLANEKWVISEELSPKHPEVSTKKLVSSLASSAKPIRASRVRLFKASQSQELFSPLLFPLSFHPQMPVEKWATFELRRHDGFPFPPFCLCRGRPRNLVCLGPRRFPGLLLITPELLLPMDPLLVTVKMWLLTCKWCNYSIQTEDIVIKKTRVLDLKPKITKKDFINWVISVILTQDCQTFSFTCFNAGLGQLLGTVRFVCWL